MLGQWEVVKFKNTCKNIMQLIHESIELRQK